MDKTALKVRNVDIVKMFMSGYTKVAVGKKYRITRERVRQIVKELAGENSPFLLKGKLTKHQWRYLNRLRRQMDISTKDIVREAGISLGAVAHTLIGTDNYITAPLAQDVFAAIVVIMASRLQTIRKFVDFTEDIFN